MEKPQVGTSAQTEPKRPSQLPTRLQRTCLHGLRPFVNTKTRPGRSFHVRVRLAITGGRSAITDGHRRILAQIVGGPDQKELTLRQEEGGLA